MNTVNRIIAILLFLLLLVIIVALALSPGESINWLQMQLSDLNSIITRYQITDPTNFNIARVAAVVAALLLLVPLIMAQFPSKGEPTVKLKTAAGGAQVTTESVEKRLAWHLDQLADVISVQPVVRSRGDQVDIRLNVDTTPEIDVPMKTEEIMLVTREIVTDSMGLKLGKLDVHLRHSAYPAVV